jgi:predicted ATP-dependent serine protease
VYRAGEVGLAGELRPASHIEARVGAAQQAGMSHCVVAAGPDAQASALAARVKRAGMGNTHHTCTLLYASALHEDAFPSCFRPCDTWA